MHFQQSYCIQHQFRQITFPQLLIEIQISTVRMSENDNDNDNLGRRLGAGSAFGILDPSRHSSAFSTPRGIGRHSGTNNPALRGISQ